MTLIDAVTLLAEVYPGRIAIGYWKNGDDYIFNTKQAKHLRGLTEPGQFVVTSDGNVFGTNPMQYDLDPDKMTKF